MPGLPDLLRTIATGQPDPYTQVMQGLQAQQGAAGAAPGAPPGGGASAAPPTAGAPPAGQPGAAPPPPQVQAYQSAPDMQQLYLKFAQQQQADEGFNRGLGLLAASAYPGRNPNAIMSAMTGNTADPGALFGNIMKIQGWQQQQKQYEAFVNSAPDIAKQMDPTGSITPNEVLAMGPDAARTAISMRIPPDALRTRNAFKQQFITDNAEKPDPANPGQKLGSAGAAALFEQQNPMSLTMAGATGAGGAAASLMQRNIEQADWQSRHQGEPIPAYFNSDEALAAHKAQVASLGASQQAAGTTLPGLEGNLADMRSKAAEILKVDPDKLDQLLKSAPPVLQASRTQGWPQILAQGVGGMTTDDLKLLQQIDELGVYNTQAMKSANPHLIPSIAPIDNALRPLSNFQLGAANFRTNTQNLIDSIDSAHAQAIGASGQLDKVLNIPDADERKAVAGKIDDSYLAGGRNFLGDAPRPPPDVLANAKAAIAQGKATPAEAVRHLKLKGFLPRPGDIPGA
jgi:hypothetical protein